MTHHTHTPLEGKRAAVMIGPLFEDTEATYPYYRLQEAGAAVELIGLEGGVTVSGKHGQPLETGLAAADLDEADVDLLVIAGGFGPDKLRTDDGIRRLVRELDVTVRPPSQPDGWSASSTRPESRSRSSATRPGCRYRPESSPDAAVPRFRRSPTTSATRARSGRTPKSSSTTTWSPRDARPTCPRSCAS